MDKFVLTFDGYYGKSFTYVMDDEEAQDDRLQTILETICAFELSIDREENVRIIDE